MEAVGKEIELVEKKIEAVGEKIALVETNIEEVEKEIQDVTEKLNAIDLSVDDKQYLRQKELLLRQKEDRLRQKKLILLKEKSALASIPENETHATKKRRMDDLLAYHKAVLETGTSKSSKLLKVKKTSDGSKRCFLCATAGTNTNKIEASHVLQQQDIYANGLGWNRPFKIHDPMNLIWLCHAHNLAFDSHCFGLTLMGLDSSVGFCSYKTDYDELVSRANQRLQNVNEPFYDMSYVSRRAIGMRLFKAQEAGHFLNHGDIGAWETVVRLSAAASVDQNAIDT